MPRSICPICKNPREREKAGTLTQWIVSCACGKSTETDSLSTTVDICRTCGKRIEAGRPGSFTQFIFRFDLCSCAVPRSYGDTADIHNESSSRSSFNHDENPDDAEEELTLDVQLFPAERYKPLQLLGTGGWGSVYLAKDKLLNRRVAVKLLQRLENKHLLAFQDEARATSALKHPSIIEILDFGVSEGAVPYMVLEYVDGKSLRSVLDEKITLPWREAQRVFIQVAEALDCAHKHGIYHRDLQPSNILLCKTDGDEVDAKLIDFGIARISNSAQQGITNQKGTIAGAPLYMSPDAASGAGFDARSDLYSLGCVLYEVLSGRPPFEGENALQLLSLHAHATPPSMLEFDDKLPSDVDALVQKAISKLPEQRYQTALEFRDALVLTNGEEQHQQSTLSAAVKTSPQPMKYFSITICAVLSALVIGIATQSICRYLCQEQPAPKAALLSTDDLKRDGFVDFPNDQKGWSKVFSEGRSIYVSGLETTDEDFRTLSQHSDVRQIKMMYSETITGEGFRFLDRNSLVAAVVTSRVLNDKGLHAISNIFSLESLSIEWTDKLTEKGFSEISRLKKLRALGIRGVRLPNNALRVIAKLSELEELRFCYCENFPSDDLQQLSRLPNLKHLELVGQKLTDKDCFVLAKLGSLQLLTLKANSISDQGVNCFSKSGLVEIDLSDNKITDNALSSLASIGTLKRLIIAGCRVTDKGIESFRQANPRCQIVRKQAEAKPNPF